MGPEPITQPGPITFPQSRFCSTVRSGARATSVPNKRKRDARLLKSPKLPHIAASCVDKGQGRAWGNVALALLCSSLITGVPLSHQEEGHSVGEGTGMHSPPGLTQETGS